MLFFEKAIQSAWKGKNGIIYPILIRLMTGVLRLVLYISIFLLMTSLSDIELSSGLVFKVTIYGFLILFFLSLVWWIFSASCRLMCFHAMADGGGKPHGKGEWLGDLPVMLGIDVIFGLLKWLCIGAMISGFIGLIVGQSVLSVLSVSLGGVIAIVCSVLQPAVTAQRIVDGPGFLCAVKNAIDKIIHYPARMMCVRFLPGIVSISLYAAAGWEGLTGDGLVMCILLVAGVLISLINPVFWTEFARNPNPYTETGH